MKNLCINYHRAVGQLSLTTNEFSVHAFRVIVDDSHGEIWWHVYVNDERTDEYEDQGFVCGFTPAATPRAVWHVVWHLIRKYNNVPDM